jgi:hypothetical protein
MISCETSFRVLSLCAARPADRAIGDRLRTALAGVRDWEALLLDAEEHGLEPLLLEHADAHGIALPPETETRLKVRCLQHAHAAAARSRAIVGVLDAFDAAGIPVLTLKGAALAHLVYPSPLLRPMCDVDLLVPPHLADGARSLLLSEGFSPYGKATSPGYHHLQPLAADVEGAKVTIEIHTALLRAAPFVAPLRYAGLAARSQTFTIGGRSVQTLGREDMLWHVYAHAFVINVLRPGIRLISIADIIAVTEAWAELVDWDRLQRMYPRLVRALPRIGQIVPWSPRVERRLGPPLSREPVSPRGVSSSTAWRDALSSRIWWPDPWWFDVRYGVDATPRRLWHRLVTHPACVALAAAETAWRRTG